jgi:hypothetical protein
VGFRHVTWGSGTPEAAGACRSVFRIPDPKL